MEKPKFFRSNWGSKKTVYWNIETRKFYKVLPHSGARVHAEIAQWQDVEAKEDLWVNIHGYRNTRTILSARDIIAMAKQLEKLMVNDKWK